jgi:hypothetical protein
MPESECRNCGEILVASTDNELIKKETEHHIDSERRVLRRSWFGGSDSYINKHQCVGFMVYDEGRVHTIGYRAYAHGLYRDDI